MTQCLFLRFDVRVAVTTSIEQLTETMIKSRDLFIPFQVIGNLPDFRLFVHVFKSNQYEKKNTCLFHQYSFFLFSSTHFLVLFFVFSSMYEENTHTHIHQHSSFSLLCVFNKSGLIDSHKKSSLNPSWVRD